MSSKDLSKQLRQVADVHPFLSTSDLIKEFQNVSPLQVEESLEECVEQGFLLRLPLSGHECYISAVQESHWMRIVSKELETYHKLFPLRQGQPREDLLSRLSKHLRGQFRLELSGPQTTVLLDLWTKKEILRVDERTVSLTGHEVKISGAQKKAEAKLAQRMTTDSFSPPARSIVLELLGGDQALLEFLLESGAYVAVNREVVYSREALLALQDQVVQYLLVNNKATMAELRDLLGISRKYVQALLEYMDASVVTRREGEVRTLMEEKKKDS